MTVGSCGTPVVAQNHGAQSRVARRSAQAPATALVWILISLARPSRAFPSQAAGVAIPCAGQAAIAYGWTRRTPRLRQINADQASLCLVVMIEEASLWIRRSRVPEFPLRSRREPRSWLQTARSLPLSTHRWLLEPLRGAWLRPFCRPSAKMRLTTSCMRILRGLPEASLRWLSPWRLSIGACIWRFRPDGRAISP